ncbi:MAG TPA: hypothetical protein VLS25_05165 [Dehalococcoidia bacterium]|nr:hypothetical protein [Dehalococcoidia bacterium]
MTHEKNGERTSLFRLIAGRGPRHRATAAISAEPAPGAPPQLPPLVLLSDDAAGPSVRRMTAFPGPAEVCEHVDFWYPPEHRDRLIAFWALSDRPVERAEDIPEAEALVLVRDHRDPALVSPFSFMSMGEAMTFVRDEMRYGLDPALVIVVWAVPVRIVTSVFGDVRVSPGRPPQVERPLQVLWNEKGPRPPAAPARPAAAPKSQIEELLGDLAAALHPRPADELRPAFAGFGSPEGRF